METSIKQFFAEYGPYLEDARRRLVFTALFFGAVLVVGFFASPYIVQALIILMNFTGVEYAVFSPFQLLSTSMDVGLFLAITCTLPLLFVELYEFLSPGITSRERGTFFSYLLGGGTLFVAGFAYGLAILYFAAWAVSSFNSSIGLANIWDISLFISQSLLTAALLGVLFQFPLVLTSLMRLGILPRKALAGRRKVAVAVTVCIVALLPPTDGLSLIVMSVPLIALYELTLLLARERKRQAVLTYPLAVRPL